MNLMRLSTSQGRTCASRRRRTVLCTAFTISTLAVLATNASAAPGLPSNGRISFGEFFSETNGRSEIIGMSDDARFVAYVSTSTNITDEDPGTQYDCFRYDRLFGITLLMSVATNGSAGTGESPRSAPNTRMITPDGRYVLFTSSAPNLVTGDNNGQPDAFIRDTNGAGSTQRVSLGANGVQIALGGTALGMTTTAQKILFSTRSSLSASDTNGVADVYLYDRSAKSIALVSSNAAGVAVGSNTAVISETGRYVAFATSAGALAADANGLTDVYWRDLTANTLKLVSGGGAGVASDYPAISGDGIRVGYRSQSAPGTGNAVHDVFVADTSTNAVTRASTKTGGGTALDSACERISLNGNGHIVAMSCRSPELSAGDGNGQADVLVKNLDANTTTLVSRVANGALGNGDSGQPVISKDGTQVGFTSAANNLEGTDNNAATDVFVGVTQ